MSITLSANETSPVLTVAAPGGLKIITLTDTETKETFDISFEDMTRLVEYFLFTPEYSKRDPRMKLIEKLENSTFVKGLNGGMIRLELKAISEDN